MKILFVCDGNICRSPMAEALLRQLVSDKGVEWMEISSAGLVASAWGVAHSQLRRVLGPSYRLVEKRPSRPLTEELVRTSDLILGMENRHIQQILERFPESRGRVDKITSYAGKDGEIRDFPDSGYGDVVSWLRHCHTIMVPCLETIADRLVHETVNANQPPPTGKVD
jgi:protein-tyrosine phosphatase